MGVYVVRFFLLKMEELIKNYNGYSFIYNMRVKVIIYSLIKLVFY